MSAKKKTISRVLALVLIVALFVPALLVVPVSAASVSASGTCGTGINWFYYSDQSFSVSGTGTMDNYTSETKTPYKSYYEKVKNLSIGEGVTYIGNSAFRSFGYDGLLTSVALPSTVTAVGEYAFYNIQGLTELTLNEGLVTIGNSAFDNCSVDEFVVPSTVKYIGSSAFYSRKSSWSVKLLCNEPPELNGNSFSTYNLSAIYVPAGSLAEYQSADSWSAYIGYLVESEPEIVYPSIAEIPSFTTNLTSATHYYLQGVTADPLVVEAVVNDGGTIEYEWQISGDLSGMVYGRGASFVPPTDIPGEYEYVCLARNKVYNPNVEGEYIYSIVAYSFTDTVIVVASSTDSDDPITPTTPDYSEKFDDLQNSMDEMPDKITDGMQDIMEQEKEQATQQGGQFVDDITGVVPNESQGFVDALGSLVSVLSYDGTECVLPIPALTLPAIGGLFPSYTVMEAQEVDFEEFFAMMPPAIMLLVQSLLTVALIVYCFKELYDTVAYFFVLKGGNK